MGRTKRNYPKGKFRLRVAGKHQPNKLYQVNIEYTWNGSIIRKATGVTARISDWNPKGNMGRGELRPSYGETYRRDNALLNKRLDKIDADMHEYYENHSHQITTDVIKGILQEKPLMRKDKGLDFCEFALERLKSKYSRNKIGYSRFKNGASALKMLGEYLVSSGLGTHKPNGIYVSEMSCELLQGHIDWRKDVKNNHDATINHALTPILDACDYACDLGYIDRQRNNALQEMRVIIKPTIDEDSREYDGRSLSTEQLEDLVAYYNKCTEPRRKEFIEMFLFAFHACGLRVADIMTLQWSSIDFNKKELSKILVKTKNRHIIPLTDSAIAILQRWKGKSTRKRFVFDLVDDDLDLNDDDALYKARNNATKCIDQSLVVVGEQMGLPFKLTMHVARHTFAVLALNGETKDGKEIRKPMSMSMVSRLLGHASTDTTEKVYAKFLPQTLADEVGKLGFAFLPNF